MTNSGDVPPYADSEIVMRPTLTVDEVIAWLKNHTDSQDTGASNVFLAIRIFEQAARKMERRGAGA